MALISRKNWDQKIKAFYNDGAEELVGGCGASLIASKWAITAAHCNEKIHKKTGKRMLITAIIIGQQDISGILRKNKAFFDWHAFPEW